VKVIRESRKRIYHCFEALLCSGMRLGELVSIPFDVFPAHRVIYDNFSKTSLVEIIINTEKTCKKREIYIPEDSYNFLCTKTRMYKKKKLWLTRQLIIQGFINFKK
jgi:intergrase/recombinase